MGLILEIGSGCFSKIAETTLNWLLPRNARSRRTTAEIAMALSDFGVLVSPNAVARLLHHMATQLMKPRRARSSLWLIMRARAPRRTPITRRKATHNFSE